jgi:hypothetical protein
MIQPGEEILVFPSQVTGTAYTPARTDAGRVLEASNGSAVTITLPPANVAGWHIGTVLQVFQQGAGQVTIAPGSGVTLRSAGGLKTASQYSVINLRMRATDEWVVSGDTAA